MRHALPVRLRRAPLHQRRQVGVALGTVDEWLARAGGRSAWLSRPRSVASGSGPTTPKRDSGSSRPMCRCSTHCSSSIAASVAAEVADQVRRVRRRALARRRVLETVALFPDDLAVLAARSADMPGMPACCRSASRYESRTGRLPPGREDRRAAARTCRRQPPAVARASEARRDRGPRSLHGPLPDERELREPHRIVSLPGPDECGVARRRVGAHADVVVGVGLERGAAEKGQAREVARQRAPGDVFLVRWCRLTRCGRRARASSDRCRVSVSYRTVAATTADAIVRSNQTAELRRRSTL